MHILILPSWYPGRTKLEGLFILEQINSLCNHPDIKITVINWGPNEFVLKLRKLFLISKLIKSYRDSYPQVIQHKKNFIEYKAPHITWTSLLMKGNYESLIKKLGSTIKQIEKDQGEIDLIHAHVTFPAGFLAYMISRQINKSYVITEHSGPFPFSEYKKIFGLRQIIQKPLENASKVIAVSNWLAKSISVYCTQKPIVIPNSIDTSFFKPSASYQQNKIPTIFCLSHLIESKGIGDLLRAILILKEQGHSFRFRIGGVGASINKYHKLSQSYKIQDRIEWLGQLNREKALFEYQNCDFYVMPSRVESLSMVILEAMACGKPIVSTDCGGPSELIKSDIGILTSPNSPKHLAESIKKMLFNFHTYDSHKIRNLCEENYSPEKISTKIINVYKEFIS